MTDERETRRTLRDMVAMLFRHKKKMIAFATVVMAIVVAGIVFAPRKYESSAALFFRIGRQSVALDPTAVTGAAISVNETLESEINSALEVIGSRELAERVVDRVGVESFNPPSKLGPAMSWLEPVRQAVSDIDPVTPREAAINRLQKALTITAPKRSRIIGIRAKADSPELAQKTADALVKEFLDLHIRLNRTDGSEEFFATQTDLLRTELEQAAAALRDLKNDMGVGTVEDARHILAVRLQAIESEHLLAQANAATAQGRVKALSNSLGQILERLPTNETSGFDNLAADHMRQQLFGLEIQEKQLSARYTDGHPLLVAIRQQLDGARNVVDGMQPARTQSTTALNPTFQLLEVERERELATNEANIARLAALEGHKQALLAEQKQLNEREIQYTNLSRKIGLLTASHRTYAEKLEESRIDGAVNDEHISNVNIAQAPTIVQRPVSPNKTILLAFGIFIAIFGSIGLAIVCEHVDESFKTPGDVEESLELPVLLSVPRVRSRSVLLN